MSAPELRQYQQDVIARMAAEIAAGHRRICLVAPTGSGGPALHLLRLASGGKAEAT